MFNLLASDCFSKFSVTPEYKQWKRQTTKRKNTFLSVFGVADGGDPTPPPLPHLPEDSTPPASGKGGEIVYVDKSMCLALMQDIVGCVAFRNFLESSLAPCLRQFDCWAEMELFRITVTENPLGCHTLARNIYFKYPMLFSFLFLFPPSGGMTLTREHCCRGLTEYTRDQSKGHDNMFLCKSLCLMRGRGFESHRASLFFKLFFIIIILILIRYIESGADLDVSLNVHLQGYLREKITLSMFDATLFIHAQSELLDTLKESYMKFTLSEEYPSLFIPFHLSFFPPSPLRL